MKVVMGQSADVEGQHRPNPPKIAHLHIASGFGTVMIEEAHRVCGGGWKSRADIGRDGLVELGYKNRQRAVRVPSRLAVVNG